MSNRQQIAFAFPRGAHQEAFIQGVFRYAADQELNWTYTIAPESLSLSVLDLVDWPGDGVLAALNTAEEVEYAMAMRPHVVNISSTLPESPVPRSMVDNVAVGRIAADHLATRGLRNFAFYGLQDVEYSKRRWMGFIERLEESGYSATKHLATPTFGFRGSVWLNQHQELAAWLESLPTPCGVFSVSDYRARHVLDACQQVNLNSPEQIAVLGVDNEHVICDHITPKLSSVARNDVLEGYRAAELLHMRLDGRSSEETEIAVPPLEVVARDSTSAFAVEDPRMKKVLEYLLTNVAEPITIDELAEHADVSRRWLEYAFRDALGETPYHYLQRQRLILAKQLLRDDPTSPVYRIAQRTGFSSVKQLSNAFQKAYGVTPGEYRKLSH
ncbi:Xylose operon regulatory protein [Posidoniimonas corsicana]|uniref:Xylose operon regulatory protein n=1 Tax=Posidoniimonas corsicana TaxID=1938618 RepID=A0A5C5VG64_9BACT|nr:xylose operon transcription regulator XylR [Posidoniimonas corsicana]TWT37634.1 Xylose operon regulatory protein [Posidoniimonas corsicana]